LAVEAVWSKRKGWEILAKEATEEKDPEKLMRIIKALTVTSRNWQWL
jgi:hypothetical protein